MAFAASDSIRDMQIFRHPRVNKANLETRCRCCRNRKYFIHCIVPCVLLPVFITSGQSGAMQTETGNHFVLDFE